MGERDPLECVSRFLHPRRPPDEDHVERRETDEADPDRPGRRDRGRGGRPGQTGSRDQRDAGRVLEETVRKPGGDPEPRDDRRPQPPTAAAEEQPAGGGEDGRAERREQGERTRPLRDEVDDQDTGAEEDGRHGDPEPAAPADAGLPRRCRRRRGLRRAEHGI